jgi:hypothetical protein
MDADYIFSFDMGYKNYAWCVFDVCAKTFCFCDVVSFVNEVVPKKKILPSIKTITSKGRKSTISKNEPSKAKNNKKRMRKKTRKPLMEKLSSDIVHELFGILEKVKSLDKTLTKKKIHVICERQLGQAHINQTLAYITKTFFETQSDFHLSKFQFMHSNKKFECGEFLKPECDIEWHIIKDLSYQKRKNASVRITKHLVQMVDEKSEVLNQLGISVEKQITCLKELLKNRGKEKCDDIGDAVVQILKLLSDCNLNKIN